MSNATQSPATILLREGLQWRQYLVITDGRVAIVSMSPALLGGWRFVGVDIQSCADWSGMTAAAITAWKLANDDGRTTIVVAIDADFRARLLARAAPSTATPPLLVFRPDETIVSA